MANEAGQGAEDRLGFKSNYTIWSNARASISGKCTRFAYYGMNLSGGITSIAFFSIDGSILTRETEVIQVSPGVYNGFHEFTSPGDFAEFDVSEGWLMGLHSTKRQDDYAIGGVGYYGLKYNFVTADSVEVGAMVAAGIDAMEADITPSGPAAAVLAAHLHRLRSN